MNKNEPLGLPRGSVRAIITFGLLILLGVCLFVPVVDGSSEIVTGLLALCVMSVRDYFTTREKQNQEDGPPLHDPVIGR